MGTMKRKKKPSSKSPKHIFNKIIQANFPTIRMGMHIKVQETNMMPNRLEKNVPSPHNNQQTINKEQMANMENHKEKGPRSM